MEGAREWGACLQRILLTALSQVKHIHEAVHPAARHALRIRRMEADLGDVVAVRLLVDPHGFHVPGGAPAGPPAPPSVPEREEGVVVAALGASAHQGARGVHVKARERAAPVAMEHGHGIATQPLLLSSSAAEPHIPAAHGTVLGRREEQVVAVAREPDADHGAPVPCEGSEGPQRAAVEEADAAVGGGGGEALAGPVHAKHVGARTAAATTSATAAAASVISAAILRDVRRAPGETQLPHCL